MPTPAASMTDLDEAQYLEKLVADRQIKVVNNLDKFDRIFVPRRFAGSDFSSFRPTVGTAKAASRMKRYAEEYSAETTTGLLLHGTPGTGKTHLAIATGKRICERGEWCYFYLVPEMLDKMRRAIDTNDDTVEVMARDKVLLILDDLAAERTTEWVNEKLFGIINHRYNEMLPTIVTTNSSPKDLAQRLGDRTVSRLLEMCEPVKCEGEDYRLARWGGAR